MTEEIFDEDSETGRVRVGRNALKSLTATNATVEQSAVQRLSADALHAENSAIGVANASTIELEESAAGVVAGDYVKVENSSVFLLLAPRVSGNVRAVLTLPTAFALGAGYYLARRLVLGLSRRSKR
jgi:hypothetical protein